MTKQVLVWGVAESRAVFQIVAGDADGERQGE